MSADFNHIVRQTIRVTRINDHHLSLAEKQAERARLSVKK